MIVLGLTGNIGMGKTTVAKEFERQGVPVCDADAIVHELIGPDGAAVAAIERVFPSVVEGAAINRKKLGAIVFADEKKRKMLESILHPLVQNAELEFLETQRELGHRVAVVEIPLLYEVGAENRCDKVAVVSASPEIQAKRVMAREGMTKEKFERILAAQWPDAHKKARADFVVDTSGTMANVRRQVVDILEKLNA